jgi:hypothetical protein
VQFHGRGQKGIDASQFRTGTPEGGIDFQSIASLTTWLVYLVGLHPSLHRYVKEVHWLLINEARRTPPTHPASPFNHFKAALSINPGSESLTMEKSNAHHRGWKESGKQGMSISL